MKAVLAWTVLAAVLGVSSAHALGVGEQAPNFKFEKVWNATDNQTQLDDYRGKLVLVEAWATW
ncbi:MAG: redoxin domain-containing protein [Planctomycetes bacterium]|jgi:hypothetical protein|nr:redoxin domain-containing protein [Planctomycetota bacterium]MCL4730396.1 redoxin domain-containing protein [Planctomycetota bacterium]